MPELPDLQVFSKNLFSKIGNKEIQQVNIYNTKKVNWSKEEIVSIWSNKKISSISRSGKELYFHSNHDDVFSVHLMLKGMFNICIADAIDSVKYKIMSLVFNDKTSLVISDPRGLCKVTFSPEMTDVPDALSSDFSYDYFLQCAKNNPRKNIKALLINQDIIKGIGNAYADEILWAANISPESTVGKIPEEYLRKLYLSIREVLENAISTIDKIAPGIINGEERSFLKIHNPEKQFTDTGDKIIVKKVASKTTYCTEKQILFK